MLHFFDTRIIYRRLKLLFFYLYDFSKIIQISKNGVKFNNIFYTLSCSSHFKISSYIVHLQFLTNYKQIIIRKLFSNIRLIFVSVLFVNNLFHSL